MRQLEDAGLFAVRPPGPVSAPDEIVVVATVRDEEARMLAFLQHYRSLGASRFIFIDNGSTDRTRELLLGHPDVALYDAPGSYSESNCGVDWVNAVLDAFAVGRWAIVADADEMLVYPHCEVVPLPKLCRYLDDTGANCFKTFLLDMYSDLPLDHHEASGGFIERYCYFDSDSYHVRDKQGIPVRGGPRHRLFWGEGEDQRSPFLIKFPLVRWMAERKFTASTHRINLAKLADVTGALLHFKLNWAFQARAEIEAVRAGHNDWSRQCLAYVDGLRRQPGMTAVYPGTRRYRTSADLVACGLMLEPDRYRAAVTSTGET